VSDFYEDDEPIADVEAAFDRSEKGMTSPADETELISEQFDALAAAGERVYLLPCHRDLARLLEAIYDEMGGDDAHNCGASCFRCRLRPWIVKIRAARIEEAK